MAVTPDLDTLGDKFVTNIDIDKRTGITGSFDERCGIIGKLVFINELAIRMGCINRFVFIVVNAGNGRHSRGCSGNVEIPGLGLTFIARIIGRTGFDFMCARAQMRRIGPCAISCNIDNTGKRTINIDMDFRDIASCRKFAFDLRCFVVGYFMTGIVYIPCRGAIGAIKFASLWSLVIPQTDVTTKCPCRSLGINLEFIGRC